MTSDPNRDSAGLRREDGFTLGELLGACVGVLTVVLAALAVVDISRGMSPPVVARRPTVQPGRAAMRTITRELRARVCLSPGGAAIVNGQTESVTFYSYEGDATGSFVPERHTITWDPGTRSLVDYAFIGIGAAPATTFPGTPTRTTTLATHVAPAGGAAIFSYYAWRAGGSDGPSVPLATPLSDTDTQRAVRIVVRFAAPAPRRAGSRPSRRLVVLAGEVVPHAEATSAAGTPGVPNCG